MTRHERWNWLKELSATSKGFLAVIAFASACAGLGAGWSLSGQAFAAIPADVQLLKTRASRMEAFDDSLRGLALEELPGSVRDLTLQVCLLRVEMRGGSNTDECTDAPRGRPGRR